MTKKINSLINKSIHDNYHKMLKESIHKLLKHITEDYSDKYQFTLDDLETYVSNYFLEIKVMSSAPKKQIKRKPILDNKRCHARTWGNGYLNVKHYKKNIDNYNKLDPTQIGKQCHRKIETDNIYCSYHCTNLAHGNYYLKPSNKIIGYFVKVNSCKF
jgi:hypothetical protein